MTLFSQFRVWLRRGPAGERVAAGTAAVVLLALVAWALVPLPDDDSRVETAAGSPTAEANSTQGVPANPTTTTAAVSDPDLPRSDSSAAPDTPRTGVPAAPTPGASNTPRTGPVAAAGGPSAGAAAAPAPGPCSGLRATDQGVTPSEIFVAVTVLNVVGLNEQVGVRGDMPQIVNAFVAELNAEGRIACRRLRVKVYQVNPLDQNEQRSRCLEIIGDKPFAVIDVAGYTNPASRQCFYDAKLPLTAASPLSQTEVEKAYPYAYNFRNSSRSAAKNFVRYSAARGTFDPARGFRKLGVLVDECDSDSRDELMRNLAAVGVKDDKLSVFTMRGCASVAPPSDLSQAVLQHRNADASHVFFGANPANSQTYVRQADAVGWKPAYLASDLGSVANSPTQDGWPDGFDGAIAITGARTGERNAGMLHPVAAQCNNWLRKHGVRPSETDKDFIPIVVCDQLRLLRAAANGLGPNLVRSSLVNGLAKVGRFQAGTFSDSLFDRPGKVMGGDFIRAIRWYVDCKCFKPVEREMRPGY